MVPIFLKNDPDRFSKIDLSRDIVIVQPKSKTSFKYTDYSTIDITSWSPLNLSMLKTKTPDGKSWTRLNLFAHIYVPRGITVHFQNPINYGGIQIVPYYEPIKMYSKVEEGKRLQDFTGICLKEVNVRAVFDFFFLKMDNPTFCVGEQYPLGNIEFLKNHDWADGKKTSKFYVINNDYIYESFPASGL